MDATFFLWRGGRLECFNLASLKVIQSISFCKFWQLSLFFYWTIHRATYIALCKTLESARVQVCLSFYISPVIACSPNSQVRGNRYWHSCIIGKIYPAYLAVFFGVLLLFFHGSQIKSFRAARMLNLQVGRNRKRSGKGAWGEGSSPLAPSLIVFFFVLGSAFAQVDFLTFRTTKEQTH